MNDNKHAPTMFTLWRIARLLAIVVVVILIAGVVQADVPTRVGVRGFVPNPGTQEQELGNITLPAPYNVFEFVVTCGACHGGTVDQQAGHFGNWAGTSMASAARDPYFRANQIGVNNAVRSALVTAGFPEDQADGAGNMCFRCHSPNGWYSGRFDPALNGDPEGTTMIHSIVLSTDDEGILCEACHRTMGNVTMRRSDLNPMDEVWNMMARLNDWPHEGGPFEDQAGDPTIADGNPYGDTTLQINDGMTYIGKYSGSSDIYMSDLPLGDSAYTGQTYGVWPSTWTGPKNPVPDGEPSMNDAGQELAYSPDGGLPLHNEIPIGPPTRPDGSYDYLSHAVSLEHPTVGSRGDLGPQPVPSANQFIRSSEFCGTCHDLTVPVLNHGMPEQRTYTEWKFSEFGDGDNVGDVRCQDCHMPTMKHEYSDDAQISLNPDPMLAGWFPYSKDRNSQGGTAFHKFAGANRDLPMAMKALYPEPDLEVIGAPTGNDPRIFPGMLSTRDPMYDRNQRNSEIMLAEGVSLEIVNGPTSLGGGRYSVQVKVTNTSGHRIPSGYPDGRRFWVALEVTDGSSNVVYESGFYNNDTATLFTDSSQSGFNRALSNTIDETSNAVMVYERVTCTDDLSGRCNPSPNLLNNKILFDNRILPKGFEYAKLREAGVKFWNYDPATLVPYEEQSRYPEGQNWDLVTYTFDAGAATNLKVRAAVYWQTHTREFVEHLREQDTSTVRPQGPPNILDPNYPLNPNYLADVIDLAGTTAAMKTAGYLAPTETLADNWGGIAYATWFNTGRGAPYLVTMAESNATAPPAPGGLVVLPIVNALGQVEVPGVYNAETGQHEPYTQKIVWDPVQGAEKYLVWVKYGTQASTSATASWDRLAIVPADQIQKVQVSVGGPEVDKVYLVSTALNVNKTFGYRVQAINGAGKSVMSAEAYGKTPWDLPLPPDNLMFLGSTLNSISMTWYDPNDNEDGHIVYRQPVPPTSGFVEIARVVPGTPGFGGVTFVDNATTNPSSPPAPSTCYNYVVEAYNGAGGSGWNANGPVQMCTKGVPGAPTNLFAIAASATQINLTWDAATGLVDGYRLERSISGQTTPAVPIALAADATSYSDTGLLPGTTYIYVLYAFNAAGDSAPSDQASAQTPVGPPAAPTNLVAVPSLPSPLPPVVTLTWTDNAGNETGFVIQRAVDNNGTPGAFVEIARTTTASTGTGLSVSYTDNTVAPKMTYWYRVASYNNSGQSDFTPQAIAITTGEIPEAPADLRVSRVDRTLISLTWLDKSTNELGFKLQRSTDGASWTDIASLGPNSTTYTNTGLRSRTTYYYRIQAFNNDGESGFSNVASARTR